MRLLGLSVSGQTLLPSLHSPLSFDQAIQQLRPGPRLARNRILVAHRCRNTGRAGSVVRLLKFFDEPVRAWLTQKWRTTAKHSI
jgi:hypothetical protein